MPLRDNFVLMADYSRWMNEKLYAVSSCLTVAEIVEDRGAFFGSVLGTLNHILVADTLWLQRSANHRATSQHCSR
jgi:uncharacterized damage-inducible protein DinB